MSNYDELIKIILDNSAISMLWEECVKDTFKIAGTEQRISELLSEPVVLSQLAMLKSTKLEYTWDVVATKFYDHPKLSSRCCMFVATQTNLWVWVTVTSEESKSWDTPNVIAETHRTFESLSESLSFTTHNPWWEKTVLGVYDQSDEEDTLKVLTYGLTQTFVEPPKKWETKNG